MIDKDEMHEVQPDDFGGEYSVEKAKDSKKTAFRLVKRLAQQKWKLLLVLASIVISSVLMLMSPKVIGAAIDQLWAESGLPRKRAEPLPLILRRWEPFFSCCWGCICWTHCSAIFSRTRWRAYHRRFLWTCARKSAGR